MPDDAAAAVRKIAEDTSRLAALAKRNDLRFLTYLLEMAQVASEREAEAPSRQEGMPDCSRLPSNSRLVR